MATLLSIHLYLLLLLFCVVRISCQKIGSSLTEIRFKTGSTYVGRRREVLSLSVNWNGTNFDCSQYASKINSEFACSPTSTPGTRNPSIEYFIYVSWNRANSPLQITEIILTDDLGSTYTIRQFCHSSVMQCTLDRAEGITPGSMPLCGQWGNKYSYNNIQLGPSTGFAALYIDIPIFGSRFANQVIEGGVRPPNLVRAGLKTGSGSIGAEEIASVSIHWDTGLYRCDLVPNAADTPFECTLSDALHCPALTDYWMSVYSDQNGGDILHVSSIWFEDETGGTYTFSGQFCRDNASPQTCSGQCTAFSSDCNEIYVGGQFMELVFPKLVPFFVPECVFDYSNNSTAGAYVDVGAGSVITTTPQPNEFGWDTAQFGGPIDAVCPETPEPTYDPTRIPTTDPTVAPSLAPTNAPSIAPSIAPTVPPTSAPSSAPSVPPTAVPSRAPSSVPSIAPTSDPINSPSNAPSSSPSVAPSLAPTNSPLNAPSSAPSIAPTNVPSIAPTDSPSIAPTNVPSIAPSNAPSVFPTNAPTIAPTVPPTNAPSSAPSTPPTIAPSIAPSAAPSIAPSVAPSNAPSITPTNVPSIAPSYAPSHSPFNGPTKSPSPSPTNVPSIAPTIAPSSAPSIAPFPAPTISPSNAPSSAPSVEPSPAPTHSPANTPTFGPSPAPSSVPTKAPSNAPSSAPTSPPSRAPSLPPTKEPTTFQPTEQPTVSSRSPTLQSNHPTKTPTSNPTLLPTNVPSKFPSSSPTSEPTNEPTFYPLDDTTTFEPLKSSGSPMLSTRTIIFIGIFAAVVACICCLGIVALCIIYTRWWKHKKPYTLARQNKTSDRTEVIETTAIMDSEGEGEDVLPENDEELPLQYYENEYSRNTISSVHL